MKKKILSGIVALAMIMAVFVPVIAENSPTHSETATIETKTTTVNGVSITITSDGSSASGAVITFAKSSKSNSEAASIAKDALSNSGLSNASNYSFATVFDLSANDVAASAISTGNGISITVKVDGARTGDTYKCIHVKSDNTTEILNCTVSSNGEVTINGIKSCSPFILVKDTYCEQAKGNGWIWSESKKACVYSVTNTSTK